MDRALAHSVVEPFRSSPEQEFRGCDVETRIREMKECLRERGSLVLREVIDPAVVDSHRARVDETYAMYSARCIAQGIDIPNAPSEWASRKGWEGIAHGLRYGQVYPEWIVDCFPGRSIYDLLDDGPLLPFLASFFAGPCRPTRYTHARRMHPLQPQEGSPGLIGYSAELRWHVDAQPHGESRFAVNLWTPLEDCGVDRPSLQAAVLPFQEARALAGYDERKGCFDRAAVLRLNDDPATLAGVPVFAPIMRRGDVFVLTHWTIHSTYTTPEMTRSRLSAEFRFDSDSAEFP